DMLEGAVKAAAVAGITHNIDVNMGFKELDKTGKNYVDIPIEDLSYAQIAQKAALHAAAKTTVYGGSFKENLINEGTGLAADRAFQFIGHELYNNDEYADLPLPPKTVTHALVGGVFAELRGGEFTSGAIATATGHVVAEYITKAHLNDILTGQVSEVELQQLIKSITQVISGATAIISTENITDDELAAAQAMSESVVENNAFRALKMLYKLGDDLTSKLRKKGKITGKDLVDSIKEQGLDIADDLLTLVDGDLNWEDALAIIDIVVGTELGSANKGKALKQIQAYQKKGSAQKKTQAKPSQGRQEALEARGVPKGGLPDNGIDYAKISTAKPHQATKPRDLNEQTVWNGVLDNPSGGRKLDGLNSDPRFKPEDGFQKMATTHKLPNGESITVHYQYNSLTGKPYDMKFTTPQRTPSQLQPGPSLE
ncbi:MAG: DUF637 domain-containing protein, partial [Candidatus Sedimenticola sp. 20ELBAFRAG]